nr:putative disease resistance protein rga4 [Quercus suber]
MIATSRIIMYLIIHATGNSVVTVGYVMKPSREEDFAKNHCTPAFPFRSCNCSDLRLTLSRRGGRLKTSVIGGFIEEILHYPFIRYLHASLKRLKLHGSPTLYSLPNEIQLFTALEELRIQNFNGMEALPDWLSCLSSLQKLCLYYCKKLMYLPILHLTDLKHLHIAYCPNLEKRCAEESSAEWLQMPHIRNIKINEKYIKGKDSEDSEDFYDYDDSDDSDYDRVDYLQEDSILENNQRPTDWEGINRFLFESDSS